jgi:hypothetical protein
MSGMEVLFILCIIITNGSPTSLVSRAWKEISGFHGGEDLSYSGL